MKNFNQGQTVRLRVTFRDFDDALVNPSSVNFFIEREADTGWNEYTAEVVHESTGVYHLDVDTSPESGVWDWRVVGTGTTPHANQGQFYVVPLNPPETDPSP